MKQIQAAVAAYLESETGIRTVCDRTPVRGEYPLLAVAVQEKGTVLLAGGTLAEHRFQVRVTAASSREREQNTALLSELTPILLRGVPFAAEDGGRRMLHPLDINTDEEALTFTLELCVALPALSDGGETATDTMQTLHFGL